MVQLFRPRSRTRQQVSQDMVDDQRPMCTRTSTTRAISGKLINFCDLFGVIWIVLWNVLTICFELQTQIHIRKACSVNKLRLDFPNNKHTVRVVLVLVILVPSSSSSRFCAILFQAPGLALPFALQAFAESAALDSQSTRLNGSTRKKGETLSNKHRLQPQTSTAACFYTPHFSFDAIVRIASGRRKEQRNST